MKNKLIISLLIILSGIIFINESFAQKDSSSADIQITWADCLPTFPGGQEKLQKFIYFNMEYPETAKKDKISGTVYISFTLDISGNLTNVKVLGGVRQDIDKEALRIVSLMPKWEPCNKNEKIKAMEMHLPIRFILPK